MRGFTLSVIKADVGSIGGHTKPSEAMLNIARERLRDAARSTARSDGVPLLLDSFVCHVGDDIVLIMSHTHGTGNERVHALAWKTFLEAAAAAKRRGLYGAGQDLLVDAPSGNIRGAGPGVAEITFDLLEHDYRKAEAALVFMADKCGPGAFNGPLYSVFCNPMHNGGMLLSPTLRMGFMLTVIDLDAKDTDRVTELLFPEDLLDIATLLANPDRFAIEQMHSRATSEQIVAVSATRLHNIAGTYVGKDDPVAVVRTQGVFPAPEEAVHPYLATNWFVTGDARGSHVMPITPMPLNSAVTGAYCQPIVQCLALSINAEGKFSGEYVDMFASPVWNHVRDRVGRAAADWRMQGFIGPTMASQAELAYTGMADALTALEKRFITRTAVAPMPA